MTIQEPLDARVLVLKTDEKTLAIVSLDLILFGSERIVAEAKTRWGVDHVILSSTHTHSGMSPKPLIIGGGQPDWTRHQGDLRECVDWKSLSEDAWYVATEDKVIAAIGEAVTNLFPGASPRAAARLQATTWRITVEKSIRRPAVLP